MKTKKKMYKGNPERGQKFNDLCRLFEKFLEDYDEIFNSIHTAIFVFAYIPIDSPSTPVIIWRGKTERNSFTHYCYK